METNNLNLVEKSLNTYLESLVGSRFKSIGEIQTKIQSEINKEVNIFISETDAKFLHDYQLDGEIGDYAFSIFYLKDRKKYLLLTEIG